LPDVPNFRKINHLPKTSFIWLELQLKHAQYLTEHINIEITQQLLMKMRNTFNPNPFGGGRD
jgi:hypothetical protein